jgi:crotonobetaine/carnitine-CoA ligase
MVTITDLLDQNAQRFADRPFLSWAEPDGRRSTLSYREVWRRVGAVSLLLAEHGVRPGDRVAVLLPNQVELAYLWFAVTGMGATLVPLDPRLTDVELATLLDQASPSLLILTAGRTVPPGGCPILREPFELDEAGSVLRAPAVAANPNPPAALLYTSGSTGRPKGCLLSQLSFTLPAGQMVDRLRLTPADVVLQVLPLHHMAGLSLLTTAAAAGARVELVARFSGSRFWQQAVTSGATVFRHLGEMLAMLCAQPPDELEHAHRLRLAYGAGAAPAAAARFTARFGVRTLEGYGLTETNTVLCGDLDQPRPGVLGDPLPHVQVRLVGPAGEILGAGSGELQVGPNPALFQGYFGDPELTEAAFDDGWYRTGDLVARDAEGRLRFLCRSNEVIRRRGENIDPTEIERVAESCPGVGRAAAVAVAAELDGTDIKLYLEPAAGHPVRIEEVRTRCTERLAAFKHPRYIEVLERLPLTATQKVDRVALRRRSAAAMVESR